MINNKWFFFLICFCLCSVRGGYGHSSESVPTDTFSLNSSASVDATKQTPAKVLSNVHAGTAWEAYNAGNYAEAETFFLHLIKQGEQQSIKKQDLMNLKLGLGYTYLKRDQFPAAKAVFEELVQQKYKLRDSLPALLTIFSRLKLYSGMESCLTQLEDLFKDEPEVLKEWDYIRSELAWAAYHAENFQTAESRFKKLQKNNPGDMNLVTGLGYALYQQGKYEALHALMQEKRIYDTPEITELKQIFYKGWLNFLENNAQRQKAWDLALTLSGSDDRALREAATAYYLNTGRFVAASWTSRIDDSALSEDQLPCHANAWAPETDVFSYYGVKEGDEGTSYLEEKTVVFHHRESLSVDKEWGAFFKVRHLSTGNETATGMEDFSRSNAGGTGSAYRRLNGTLPDNFPITPHEDDILYEAWLTYKKEGVVPIDIALGSSPVGGHIDATPAFTISVQYQPWRLELHRQSVGDSHLSISGFQDPYGDEVWGRVMKNGLSAGGNFPLGQTGWLSLNGGYDVYRGVNVWKNSSWHFNGAIGRTVATSNGNEVSWGLYVTCAHFENNSNFYTFGHGGYYSPDLIIGAGPLLRYQTPPCREYRLDIQLSLGGMFEKTADAPRYPIHYEIIDDFSSAALAELQGSFRGEKAERLTGSVKVEGWKMLSRQFAAGGFASLDSGSDHTQWYIGAELKYAFKPRKGFGNSMTFEKRVLP